MIDIEKIYYSNLGETMEGVSHNGWSLVLSKFQKEMEPHTISITLMHQKKLKECIKAGYTQQIIIVNLRLKGISNSTTIDYIINLLTNPEIEVLIQLLFTRFENEDKSYSIEVAIEMIKRKSFQKNANNLKNYFEVFNLICFIRKNIY